MLSVAIPCPYDEASERVRASFRRIHAASRMWPWDMVPECIPTKLTQSIAEKLALDVQVVFKPECKVSFQQLQTLLGWAYHPQDLLRSHWEGQAWHDPNNNSPLCPSPSSNLNTPHSLKRVLSSMSLPGKKPCKEFDPHRSIYDQVTDSDYDASDEEIVDDAGVDDTEMVQDEKIKVPQVIVSLFS